jgi:O-antigen ligase
MTIPGTHPIPFGLLMASGVVIAFAWMLNPPKTLAIGRSKLFLVLNFSLLLFMLIVQILGNSRGSTLCMIFGIITLIVLGLNKSNFFKALSVVSLAVFAPLIVMPMIPELPFSSRFINMIDDQSIEERKLTIDDAFEVINSHPLLGIGAGNYSEVSFVDYPHNFFLDYIVSFGFLGMVLSLAWIVMLMKYCKITIELGDNNIKILYVFILLLFMQTQFSFTLWMHKGLYLMLGLFSGAIILINKAPSRP